MLYDSNIHERRVIRETDVRKRRAIVATDGLYDILGVQCTQCSHTDGDS